MNCIRVFKITAVATILLFAGSFLYADDELSGFVKSALGNNPELKAAEASLIAAGALYQSEVRSALPALTFDSGAASPLYRYSSSDEFTATSYVRTERHGTGGGLRLDSVLPTGAVFSLNGRMGLDISRGENDSNWKYLASPSASLYLNQPLFTDRLNGKMIRFDYLELSGELAGTGRIHADINRLSVANRLVINTTASVLQYNNLLNHRELQKSRLALSERRLKLAAADEQRGLLSRIDLIAEELQVGRLGEALLEIENQLVYTASEIYNLTGKVPDGRAIPVSEELVMLAESAGTTGTNTGETASVGAARAEMRRLELLNTIVQSGREPVVEFSASFSPGALQAVDSAGEAVEQVFTSAPDMSLGISVTMPLIDWGSAEQKKRNEFAEIEASRRRIEAAEAASDMQIRRTIERMKLIKEKILLVEEGLEYDLSMIEREELRKDAGLSSETAVETIRLDQAVRAGQLTELEGELLIAGLELLSFAGVELAEYFR